MQWTPLEIVFAISIPLILLIDNISHRAPYGYYLFISLEIYDIIA
jgi:hypothetical protein